MPAGNRTDCNAPNVHRKRASWMRDHAEVLAPFALTQICLPGSHNSGTYAITSNSGYGCDGPSALTADSCTGDIARFFAGDITANWARCQGMSITQQLQFGVRYFDFRVAPNTAAGGALYLTHSMLADSLAAAIEDVYAFSKSQEGKGEFIILDFQSLHVNSDEELDKLFYPQIDSIADRCVPNTIPLSTPIGELLARSDRERLFVLVDRKFECTAHPKAFPRSSFLTSKWKDQQKVSKLVAAFDEDLVKHNKVEQRAAPTRFNVTQGVLTPGAKEIVRGAVICCYKATIEDLAEDANADIMQWFYDWNTSGMVNGTSAPVCEGVYRNVLMLDFVEHGAVALPSDGENGTATVDADLVDLCIHLNARLASARTHETGGR